MFRLVCCVFALGLVTAAEADVGLGLSAKNDNTTVYVPITAGRFMFEPYFRYSDDEFEDDNAFTIDTEAHALGVGVFRLVEPNERVTFYYGGRVARLDQEQGAIVTEGHSIAPVAGFQYHVIERLSIGAELGVDRSEIESVRTTPGFTIGNLPPIPPSISTTNTISTDTKAELIVRFFF
jgi:hypothetical protein